MNISFVVLHYLTVDDTINCVDSLLVLKENNAINNHIDIIIVDNKSPNDSLNILLQKYDKIEGIHFIPLEENLGFAKGNNAGFKFAKEKLYADYIVLLNNDTIINQSDFVDELLKISKQTNFDILGPKIISLVDGLNQNPVPYALNSKFKVIKRLIKFISIYILSYLNLDLILTKNDKKKAVQFNDLTEYQLFGCCFIFSKNYINQYDGLYSKTFMYVEEDILKYIVVRDNLKMLYTDELVIYHKEGSSTNNLLGKGQSRRRFYYLNTIKSLILLLKLMIGIE